MLKVQAYLKMYSIRIMIYYVNLSNFFFLDPFNVIPTAVSSSAHNHKFPIDLS